MWLVPRGCFAMWAELCARDDKRRGVRGADWRNKDGFDSQLGIYPSLVEAAAEICICSCVQGTTWFRHWHSSSL